MVETVSVKMGFPGGRRVMARVGEHIVLSDQPRAKGGDDEAPSPYELLLASIGTCAGFYALSFCQSRDIPCEGLEVSGDFHTENGTLVGADLHVRPPDALPEKYRDALLRSVDRCSVKRSIQAQPTIRVHLKRAAEQPTYPH